MAKLALIATFPELAATAREVAHRMGERLIVLESRLEQGAEMARLLAAQQQIDVFISRGPTIDLVRQSVEVPVTDCNPTAFDLVQALHGARAYGKRVGLISFYDLDFDARRLEVILGITLSVSAVCQTLDGIRKAVAEAVQIGVDVLVGGGYTVQVAAERGLPVVLLESGPETLSAAIAKARELAQVRRQELARFGKLQAILDFCSDGILAVDDQGALTTMNPSAAKILGVPREAQHQRAGQVVASLGLDQLLANPRPELGTLRTIGETTLAVNLIPIMVGEEASGAVATFQAVTQIQKLEAKIRRQLHTKGLVAKFTFEDLFGSSEALRQAVWKARSYAAADSTVLLIGETGTGKELVAQSIHNGSPRRNGPFVAVNCAALPENLLESELFGYEEGAFTGARRGGKTGLFELAHGGTIFLDEINATSLALQARLLRVIQEREVMRLGGDRVVPLDVRVIAATNQPLSPLVAAKQFRADLYYRLNVLKLVLPPLRERLDDIPLLFDHFVNRLVANPGVGAPTLPPNIVRQMKAYAWPGNIRELENFAQKYLILRDQLAAPVLEQLLLDELSETEWATPVAHQSRLTAPDMQALLAQFKGNRSRLAQALGVSRTTLWKLLRSGGDEKGERPQ